MSNGSRTKIETAIVQERPAQDLSLIDKIRTKSAKVGVIGLGYVGLPLCLLVAEKGFEIIGFDTSEEKVAATNQGKSTINDISDSEIQAVQSKFRASHDLDELSQCDVIVIAVPTPLTKTLTPDLSYIRAAAEAVRNHLRPGQFITLESTTYPGTTDDVLVPILEESNLRVETDFFVAHSPERVDPGNKVHKTENTPKIVGGVGPESLKIAEAFYGEIITSIVPVSSAKSAELVKVYENTFRAVNVGMVNELMLLCDCMGLDVWEVLDAAYTKPFGIMPFYPGPGVGGHCIPLDPHYLEHKAKEFNFNTQFIAVAGAINRSIPRFVVEKSTRILNQVQKSVKGSKIIVAGVAYKRDIDDFRESPALEVIRQLQELGAEVEYCDPYCPQVNEHGLSMSSVKCTTQLLQSADLVIITTDHTCFDIGLIVENAAHVLDTRNCTKGLKAPNVTLL